MLPISVFWPFFVSSFCLVDNMSCFSFVVLLLCHVGLLLIFCLSILSRRPLPFGVGVCGVIHSSDVDENMLQYHNDPKFSDRYACMCRSCPIDISLDMDILLYSDVNMSQLMRLWHLLPSVNSVFNTHAQQSTGALHLIFGRILRLLLYFMCANSEGSGETARLPMQYHNLMNWLIYWQTKIYLFGKNEMKFDYLQHVFAMGLTLNTWRVRTIAFRTHNIWAMS